MKTYTIKIYAPNGSLRFSGKCRALSFDAAYAMAELSAHPGDTIKIS